MEIRYMTIKDYAAKFGITRQTVYNMINDGRITPQRIGSQQLIPVRK